MHGVFTKPRFVRALRPSVVAVAVAVVLGTAFTMPSGATTTSQPVANWGTVYSSPTIPWGGMFWDGSHLWVPTETTMTELAPNDNNATQIVPFTGFSTRVPWGSTVVELDGHIFATGFSDSGVAVVEIDPSLGQQVSNVDLDTLNPNVNTAIPGGFVSGSSIVFLDYSGGLWRYTPGSTPTVTSIGGLSGPQATSIHLAGSTLWLGFADGSLAAYDFSSTTTTLGTPTSTVPAPQNGTAVAALTSDSRYLWAVEGDLVLQVDLSTGLQVGGGAISLGSVAPTSIASDGTWVWYVDPNGNPGNLYAFSISDPTQIISMPGPYPTSGNGLNGVYFDGTDLWVLESQDQTVEQLKLLPSQPTITSALETSPGSVTLTFTPPSDPGNQPIASSELLVAPAGPAIRATPVNPSGTTISGLAPGTRYCFSIRSTNGPYSSTSAPACVTTASTPSTVPERLAATGSSLEIFTAIAATSVILGTSLILGRRQRAWRRSQEV
jgi:Fibronectin type III domain